MKNRHAALAAAFVVLVATVAYFVLRAPDEAADLSRFDAAPDVQAAGGDDALGDVDLAGTAVESGSTEAEAIVAEPVEPTRVALDGRLDGRRWSDLLLAVDDTTGEPIDGANVIHVTGEGERTVRDLASFVEDGDLDEFTLAALDTDRHCPRAFFPADLLDVTDGPLRVRMHPSAVVRVEFVGEAAASVESFAVTVERTEAGVRAARADSLTHGHCNDSEWPQVVGFAPVLAGILAGSDSALVRGRRVRWAVRTSSVHGLFELARSPLDAWTSTRASFEASTLPQSIADLPAGSSVSLYSHCAGGDELSDAVGNVLQPDRSIEYALPFVEPIVLSLRAFGRGKVIGRIPQGVFDVSIEVTPDTWRQWPFLVIDDDGGFELDSIVPGPRRLEASWIDGAGFHQRAVREFVLEAGQIHDVGLLTPNDGSLITFTPVVVVNGEVDRSRLGGRVEPTTWGVWLSPMAAIDEVDSIRLEDESLADPLDEAAARERASILGFGGAAGSFEPIQVAGVPVGGHTLRVWGFALPDDVGAEFRARWEYPQQIVVGADSGFELRLVLEPATPFEVTVVVPPEGPNTSQSVSAMAWNSATEEVVEVDFGRVAVVHSSRDWATTGHVSLGQGSWVIFVAADARSVRMVDDTIEHDIDPSQLTHYAGRLEVAVTTGQPQSVTVPLTPGASVRGGVAEFGVDPDDGFSRIQLVPVGAPRELGTLWDGSRADDEGRFTVNGLLPNTEYSVVNTDRLIRTGAAGSLTEL
ncbi:hypothetical protein Pla163_03310 [Planctomycetes bacterium Pla163]|uniref:Uncharacterized protein n=1 Tax=Rohdeia mirabilis TaxID=2528008 RepID=A0A518CVH4_9BACT|nr:hypothetical protein Pla163_03310 [Planctomycetes bacterium Pla163]